MAVVHILKARAKSSFSTFEFPTYNEAVAYRQKASALSPSKPYKRLRGVGAPVWCVTIAHVRKDRATYQRFDTTPGYLGWKVVA